MAPLSRIRGHWLTFAAIAGLLGSSLGVPIARAAPAAGSLPVINIAMLSDNNTLDPAVSSSRYDRQVLNNVMDKLFDLNAKGDIVPMLATAYTVSKDHLTYTLTLRRGVTFQDGAPFNAQAVKFNLDRYHLPSSAPRAAELKLVQSVTAVGPYTVQLSLSRPFAPLI